MPLSFKLENNMLQTKTINPKNSLSEALIAYLPNKQISVASYPGVPLYLDNHPVYDQIDTNNLFYRAMLYTGMIGDNAFIVIKDAFLRADMMPAHIYIGKGWYALIPRGECMTNIPSANIPQPIATSTLYHGRSATVHLHEGIPFEDTLNYTVHFLKKYIIHSLDLNSIIDKPCQVGSIGNSNLNFSCLSGLEISKKILAGYTGNYRKIEVPPHILDKLLEMAKDKAGVSLPTSKMYYDVPVFLFETGHLLVITRYLEVYLSIKLPREAELTIETHELNSSVYP